MFKAGIDRLSCSVKCAQLKSKNRQKGGQFFYQMSDFCENCNPYFSKSYTPPPPLVNVWLIHNFQRHDTEIVYMFKDFYWFELWEFVACSNRQFEWAWSFKHVPLPLKRDPCSSQAGGTHKVTRKINIYCCLRNKKISEGWSNHAKLCVDQKLLGSWPTKNLVSF